MRKSGAITKLRKLTKSKERGDFLRRTENVKHKTLHPRATGLGNDRDITELLRSESKSKIFIFAAEKLHRRGIGLHTESRE